MDPFTLGAAAIGAVGGWLGQHSANETNLQSAREQMAFQERMDSTRAQRAVADYKAAGLNPALAYDRPAGSPAGAMAMVGNEGAAASEGLASGVSSALAVLRATADVRKATAEAGQAEADEELKRYEVKLREYSERDKDGKEVPFWKADVQSRIARFLNDNISLPYAQRAAKAAALLAEAQLPEAEAKKRYYQKVGIAQPILDQVHKFLPFVMR